MLSTIALQNIWLIIEQLEGTEVLLLSDVELIHLIQKQLATEMILTDAEIRSSYEYIQSRILLIRDLAEVRSTNIKQNIAILV